MGTTFSIAGTDIDFDQPLDHATWANFHVRGAAQVCLALELGNPTYGSIRAVDLLARCRRFHQTWLADDPELLRRVRLLEEIATRAGQLGRIIWF